MVRAFILLIICVSAAIAVQSQGTFQKLYLGSSGDQLYEMNDGNIFSRISYQNGYSVLSASGDVLYTRSYSIDTLLGIISIRKLSDENYIFLSGYRKDSCSTSGTTTTLFTLPAIGKMDATGNVLSLVHYRLPNSPCWSYPSDMTITDDNGVITWGAGNACYALKVDSSFTPVWGKSFDVDGGFQFIKELPGGDLLAGMNMDMAGAVLARIDPDGNFLWLKSYIRPRGMVHDVVIESDDSFIITGFTDSTASTNPFIPYPPDYHPRLFIMNLNGAGEVQWCKGYDSAPNLWYSREPSRIVQTSVGEYALLATLGYPQNNFFFRPFLMKTDVNGDTLWTRSVGSEGYNYYTQSLLAYSDGGLMFSGGIWGSLPDGNTGLPYIFKTDSLGHFICHEQHYPLQIMDLFPTDSSFILTSIDGATIHPAFVTDTIYDPINVYDACMVLPTGISSITQRKQEMRVYPNPNSGYFKMEFVDPLRAESYYSVFDTMGRLLFQRPLNAGSTLEEVDLSRFAKGTYLLKFTNPDGVCYERVMLE